MLPQYILHFDGASRGNPGHSGCSAALSKITTARINYALGAYEANDDDDTDYDAEYEELVWFDSDYIGSKCTSNQAEYKDYYLD
jgi:ribonuclease HI